LTSVFNHDEHLITETLLIQKHMGVGRGAAILKSPAKKFVFMFRLGKNKFHHFGSLKKSFVKSTIGPPGKVHPTPMQKQHPRSTKMILPPVHTFSIHKLSYYRSLWCLIFMLILTLMCSLLLSVLMLTYCANLNFSGYFLPSVATVCKS